MAAPPSTSASSFGVGVVGVPSSTSTPVRPSPRPAAPAQDASRSPQLDDLLADLEQVCQRQPSHGHGLNSMSATTASAPAAASHANGHGQAVSSTTTMEPLHQNLNELDVLLNDLSQARYAEEQQHQKQHHVEKQTTMTTTVIQGGGVAAPSPPERRPPEADAVIRELVQSRQEERVLLTEGGATDKWEYVGYGVWDNTESEADEAGGGHAHSTPRRRPGPPPPPPVTAATTTTTRVEVQETSSTTKVASSATHELDELMTSLNTFKLREKPAEEPVNTTLDDMLGNLQEDMDKQGVKTTQKGVCAACQKPIVGQVITALGRTWHPEHFVCAHCNQELGTQNFFERDGRSYCEQDYHRLFSPRCARCQQAILDKCVSALDQTWHPACFVCADCGDAFGDAADADGGFHERDGKAFCQRCFFSAFAPRCAGCQRPIAENYISSLGRHWHTHCFVCHECRQPFAAEGNFFEHEGHAYCEQHYHALRGSLCASCQKPISGRCITAMFRKFHPEHFVCSFCLRQLNKGTFKEKSEKPYCHECHDRLFG